MRSIVELAHHMIRPLMHADDVMVDATMGNGHDTLFLAKHVKKVYAFDIQQQAINSTQKLLDLHHVKNVHLIHDSHERVLDYVQDFEGVVFNLGYLPSGDKTITTTWQTTRDTLHMLLDHLPFDGFILIVIYPGHPEGKVESDGLTAYLSLLDPKVYRVIRCDLPIADIASPYFYLIKKNASR